jgi:hypothetical protein
MGRWVAEEEAALNELKAVLKFELAGAAQFPGNSLPILVCGISSS